jgi:hypothetical protein
MMNTGRHSAQANMFQGQRITVLKLLRQTDFRNKIVLAPSAAESGSKPDRALILIFITLANLFPVIINKERLSTK